MLPSPAQQRSNSNRSPHKREVCSGLGGRLGLQGPSSAGKLNMSDSGGSPRPAGELPEGWRVGGQTEEGAPFFYHPDGSTTWDPPVWLPEGWEQKVDTSSGRCWCAAPCRLAGRFFAGL